MRFRNLLLALLILAGTGRAGTLLSLNDYRQWQQFNGWKIRSVSFPGIQSFARSDLADIIATERPPWYRQIIRFGRLPVFNAEDYAGDLFRIEHFYAREGYPHARIWGEVIPSVKKQQLTVKFHIEEGAPLILQGWRIVQSGEIALGLDSARWSKQFAIANGKRLALSDVIATTDTLQYRLRNIGHAIATVSYEIVQDSINNVGQLTLNVNAGPYCLFGGTRIEGLKQVSNGTARRELAYEGDQPYSLDKIEQTRQNLVRLQTFNMVTVRPDTAGLNDHRMPMFVDVVEGRRYHVGGGVGYDTQERARVAAEFADLNFFGRARRFTWKGSWAEFRRSMEFNLFWPHTPWNVTDITLAPKWNLELPRGARVESRTTTTILSARPLPYVTAAISNEVGLTVAHYNDNDSTSRYTKSAETFSVGWDTRDNPLIPRRGHYLSGVVTESGAFYRTSVRWWRAIGTGVGLYPLSRFTVLAGRFQVGVMGPLHDTNVTPREERFRLSSANYLRGWDPRRPLSPRSATDLHVEVGGNFSIALNAEVRRNIYGPITLAAFVDAGNVWSNERMWKPANLYPSIGTGLLVLSPVGPLRLDYGYQLRPNPYKESRWGLSLSLGAPF